MGDTGLFGDMRFIAEYHRPDLILIPIGGHFVIDPKVAAYATREYLKPRYAIPMDYATFPLLKGTPGAYIGAPGETRTKVMQLDPGDRVTF